MTFGNAAWDEDATGGPQGRRESGIHARVGAHSDTVAVEAESELELGALLDSYDASGSAMSVGTACALGTQLCDALHRLHRDSEASGGLRAHGRVSFGTVSVSSTGGLTLADLRAARTDVDARAVDVRDAAIVVTELLGGQAAAHKLLPRQLGRVVERAINGVAPGERPVRAADLARALAIEAATPREVHAELQLLWPRSSTPVRLPPPPRVPVLVPVAAQTPEWRPAAPSSDTRKTIPARPSARAR